MLKVYTDGGSRGNPGKSASAFVIVENDKIIFQEVKFLQERAMTNNEAEYYAIIFALEAPNRMNVNEILIRPTSQEV